MSALEDLDFEDDSPDYYEDLWYSGWHETREGKQIKIKKMTNEHLANAIVYFKNRKDTTPLQEELDLRTKL